MYLTKKIVRIVTFLYAFLIFYFFIFLCNVLYNLAKGLGTPRLDGSDSRFPAKRMPMGLVEYATNFFVADKMQQVYTTI